MSDPKYSGTGADWTQLLTDPALVSHLGELLQVYREAPAEKRDQALLEAMRNIKGGTAKATATSETAASAPEAQPAAGAAASTTGAGGDQSSRQSAIRTGHFHSHLGRGPPPSRSHAVLRCG